MPSTFAAKYGPWAVVAGASEGLGAAYAEALAVRGVKLVLLARRAELLEGVAARLRTQVEVRTEALDLARPDLGEALGETLRGLDIGLGIYNAAFAPRAAFTEAPLESLTRVIDVNVRGPLIFARSLAPGLVARGRGGLVLMSSLAGFQGAPRIAAYAASKAFNIVLAEGLWRELGAHGVDVLVSAAGAVRTPGYASAADGDAPGTLDAREVAETTLDALGNGPLVIPGRVNRIARFVMGRLLSRRAAVKLMARSTEKLS